MWKRYPLIVLFALLFLHTLAHVDRNMLLGFAPQIVADLQLSGAQYGFLAGAVWVLSFGVMAVLLGSLADGYSRPRIIASGLMVWSVCTAASGLAQNFEHMVLARFFVASGEAALVPAAVAIISELFSDQKRSSAIGLFFIGIPLGMGGSFLLAGSLGATAGWRHTFFVLGVVGAIISLPLFFLKEERQSTGQSAMKGQFKRVIGVIRGEPIIRDVIIGFVLIHLMFVSLAFVQLWLVRERGYDAASMARTIGGLHIVVGTLGSLLGGALADRLAKRLAGGLASFMALLVLVLGPWVVVYRFVEVGSPLFYLGMCASVFLPIALYGPANALIQGYSPLSVRSTIIGCIMMLINVIAIALGNLVVGWVSDRLSKAGVALPLTWVLLAADLLALSAIVFFALAARRLAARRDSDGPILAAGAGPMH